VSVLFDVLSASRWVASVEILQSAIGRMVPVSRGGVDQDAEKLCVCVSPCYRVTYLNNLGFAGGGFLGVCETKAGFKSVTLRACSFRLVFFLN
jgi:hypothetical protein